ncbi:MAG TPA: acyl carrier protein [Ferruginibacter sp.]|jgi:acyl carrier protein|nr:acyl carrier protein [Ferruginibacter sp.]MBN8698633.1 acyl carrier protein [Chitinophagales bacterium]HMU71460.1 acyl carrier protein [Ferruginibacter sp.]HMW26847.1 acyl carrier protein [Ferruginibacter sp.]HMX36606.1 acyl carrier protein [Ferruginibacter sp.]
MTNTEILEKIHEFLTEEFEVDAAKLIPEANLKETLGLDSLDYIDLVVVIENNFGFKVKPEDFTNIITFQDFCDYVISRVNSKELA